jgi:hypothetical protein
MNSVTASWSYFINIPFEYALYQYIQSRMSFAVMTMNSVTSSRSYFIDIPFEHAFYQLPSVTYGVRTYDHEFSHILLELFYI